MIEWIENYWNVLIVMTAEMVPYLLLGFLIAGLLHSFVPNELYSRHLAPNNMGSVIKAALLGIPLPLCSCGVIPTSVSLKRNGASTGSCISFLIATPQTGVDSIAATYSMLGLPFAIIRPIVALFTAMFGGWLANHHICNAEMTNELSEHCHCSNKSHKKPCCKKESHNHLPSNVSLSFIDRLTNAFRYGFINMIQDVGKWLVIGLLVAALISVVIPNDWFSVLHEYKLLSMLIVLAIAIPMYLCATGSIPIAASLMAKGLTPGAALVLLMAGPAVNSASMLVIGKAFGQKILRIYLTAIIVGAILFGLIVDYLLPSSWFMFESLSDTPHHHTGLTIWNWIFIVLFLLLLVNAFILLLRKQIKKR